MAQIGNMRDVKEFREKGTSLEEKVKRAEKFHAQDVENFKIATGVDDVTDTILTLAAQMSVSAQMLAHFRGMVAEREAEKARAKREAERQAQIAKLASEIAARLGTTDPEKIMEAFRAVQAAAENKE